MRRMVTVMALVMAFPLAAAAQQGHGHGQEKGKEHGQRQGMHHGMMQGHGMAMMMAQPGPGMVLRLQGTLGLSEDQVSELEAMHAEAHESMRMHHEAAAEARERAHEAMSGADPDLEAFESALEEAAQHQVQAMVAMARVHAGAGEVLNADQRETLHTLMQAMHEMGGEGMHGEGESMHEGARHREMRRSGG